jgi:hypothetical protein
MAGVLEWRNYKLAADGPAVSFDVLRLADRNKFSLSHAAMCIFVMFGTNRPRRLASNGGSVACIHSLTLERKG